MMALIQSLQLETIALLLAGRFFLRGVQGTAYELPAPVSRA